MLVKLLVFLALWAIGAAVKNSFNAEQAPTTVVPPALPRRVKRQRGPKGPPGPAPEAPEVSAPNALHITTSMLQVTRPARAAVHADFRGRGALRRAMIAQEVLGPPLALRPPRC